MTEVWVTILAAAGAMLLALAAVVGIVYRRRPGSRGRLARALIRAAAVASLIVAALLAATIDGSPSLFDVGLLAIGLVLAASAIHLAFALALGLPGGVWPVDALLAGLLALLLLLGTPGVITLDCAQHALPFFVAWALYLLGGGALLVAGGAGAVAWATRNRPQPADGAGEQSLLLATLLLALVALGGGLLVGAWWAWQTTGTLLASDQRQAWIAVAWLVAGMALLAGELEERVDRWIAALAVIAAFVVVFGLFILPDLLWLWAG